MTSTRMQNSNQGTGDFSPLHAGLSDIVPAPGDSRNQRRRSSNATDVRLPAQLPAAPEPLLRRSSTSTAEHTPLANGAQHYPALWPGEDVGRPERVRYPNVGDAPRRDSQVSGAAQQHAPPWREQPSVEDDRQQQQLYPPRDGPLPDRPPRRSSHPPNQAARPVDQQPQHAQPQPQRMQPQQATGPEAMDTEKARLGPEAVGAGKARPGSLGGEGGAGKPVVLCEAHAFTDPEMGALEKAGGLGMLGHRFYRQTTVNWYGWFLYLFYLGALGFYLYVRITKTLGLGKYFTGYGIVLLVIECMGASTVLTYGLWLLYHPVQEDFEEDPHKPGMPKVKLAYHVRVLVPCYKEELDIVQRTVLAALAAHLPGSCARTVYLCDDGKDAEKRRWVANLGRSDLVYVSGRARRIGEMNGKSGNLNNVTRQIYPVEIPVPGHELICIFDADQVAKPHFFARTLPLFDAGDDVGMVLSPQCFGNLNRHCDIFNHSNLQFWEYMQPGYDAWGFISCTGTNFLVRAKAFMEAGGSPTYTLTEDFALGMELKKLGWQCRYVQEYLAVGEAPSEIRNCFQQRSRWTKGHFQIILNPTRSPLVQWRLRLFDRIMYCSGCWSYTVGAITTPVFIAIPFLTIWIGVFPVVISRIFTVALTIYTLATQMLLYYVRSPCHYEALWFANVANSILWWAFVKAWWRALITRIFCCCTRMNFKATAKGKGRLAVSAVGDIWLHALAVALLSATIAIGVWQLVAGAKALSPLLISVLWAVYAIIPPFLLCSYATFGGPGIVMHALCFLCALASTGTGLAAVGVLWAIPKYNSAEFSGGLVSQEDIGVLFRFIHSLGGQNQNQG